MVEQAKAAEVRQHYSFNVNMKAEVKLLQLRRLGSRLSKIVDPGAAHREGFGDENNRENQHERTQFPKAARSLKAGIS